MNHPWRSAAAHVAGRDDRLVRVGALLERFGDWKGFLGAGLSEEELASVRGHERLGRPLGDEPFVTRLERMVGRVLHPGEAGPKGPWKEKSRKRSKIQ